MQKADWGRVTDKGVVNYEGIWVNYLNLATVCSCEVVAAIRIFKGMTNPPLKFDGLLYFVLE